MTDPFFWAALASISSVNLLLWLCLYREHRRGVERFVVIANAVLLGMSLWKGWIH